MKHCQKCVFLFFFSIILCAPCDYWCHSVGNSSQIFFKKWIKSNRNKLKKKKILFFFSVVPTSTRRWDVVRNPIKERQRPTDNERRSDRTDASVQQEKKKKTPTDKIRKKKDSKVESCWSTLVVDDWVKFFSRFIQANNKKKENKNSLSSPLDTSHRSTNQIKSFFFFFLFFFSIYQRGPQLLFLRLLRLKKKKCALGCVSQCRQPKDRRFLSVCLK